MIKSADPQIQRIHKENADRVLFASFVSGLSGSVGHHVRISRPQTLGEALNLALSVQEAKRQERKSESFYARSEKSVRWLSEPKGRPHSGNRNKRYSGETQADRQVRSQRQGAPASKTRMEQPQVRKTQSEAAVRFYECDGRGHFVRECPTRLRNEKKLSDSPGRKTPSERSKRSHAPGDKQGNGISGNESEA